MLNKQLLTSIDVQFFCLKSGEELSQCAVSFLCEYVGEVKFGHVI